MVSNNVNLTNAKQTIVSSKKMVGVKDSPPSQFGDLHLFNELLMLEWNFFPPKRKLSSSLNLRNPHTRKRLFWSRWTSWRQTYTLQKTTHTHVYIYIIMQTKRKGTSKISLKLGRNQSQIHSLKLTHIHSDCISKMQSLEHYVTTFLFKIASFHC